MERAQLEKKKKHYLGNPDCYGAAASSLFSFSCSGGFHCLLFIYEHLFSTTTALLHATPRTYIHATAQPKLPFLHVEISLSSVICVCRKRIRLRTGLPPRPRKRICRPLRTRRTARGRRTRVYVLDVTVQRLGT